MRHLFEFVQKDRRTKFFWPLVGLSFLVMAVMHLVGKPLITEAAPWGMISFELAGSAANAEMILASWNQEATVSAAFNLGFDFLFIPVYIGTIALGCGIVANALRKSKKLFSSLGFLLSWGVILAGSLDVIENIALLKILFGSVASPWPEIARLCAVPKFCLINFVLIYIICGSIVKLAISSGKNIGD